MIDILGSRRPMMSTASSGGLPMRRRGTMVAVARGLSRGFGLNKEF